MHREKKIEKKSEKGINVWERSEKNTNTKIIIPLLKGEK